MIRRKIRKTLQVLLGCSLFVLLALAPSQVSEGDFINFKLPQIRKEKITKLIIDKSLKETAEKYAITEQNEIEKINKVAVTFKTEEDADSFAKEVQNQDREMAVEQDVEVRAFSFNDPRYSSQTNLSQMKMQSGWSYLAAANTVKIAIIDTGIKGTHEELSGRVVAGYNVLTSSPISAGADSDDNNHGTAMASIAVARANNGKGIVGTVYNGAGVIPIKALNSAGKGVASNVAAGLIWAVDHGADVANLSLGSSVYSQTLHDAIQYAISHRTVVVAASGNDGGSLAYPASDSLTLSVGSVNSSNRRSSFSNYGSELDLVAPGEGIWAATDASTSSYGQASGTSVSAAEVSGIVALGVRWHQGVSVSSSHNYLTSSATKVSFMGSYNRTNSYGYGLVNYNEMLKKGSFSYQFANQNHYPTLSQGESYNFVVRVKNNGSSTWRQDVIHLGTSRNRDRTSRFVREGDGPSGWISPNRIKMQERVVHPGQNATFSFWMRNDNLSPGNYKEYFQLVADGTGWLQDYGIYWDVRVPTPTPAFSYSHVSQNGYPGLIKGWSYRFVLIVRNTGSATWNRNVVHLGTSHNKDRISPFTREARGSSPSGWTSPNRIKMQESSVAPGHNATFIFHMRNDGLSPGTYREYFQVVADGVGWMQDYGIYWDVSAI